MSEPAFPSCERIEANGKFIEKIKCNGMTLRDYFAAKAMQAMQAGREEFYGEGEELATDAYTIADAMLKERAK